MSSAQFGSVPQVGHVGQVGQVGGVKRPRVVTAAAVMGIIYGVLLLLVGGVLTAIALSVDELPAWMMIMGPLMLLFGGLFIWGAVLALRGKSRTQLIAACGALVVFNVIFVGWVLATADGNFVTSALPLVMIAVILRGMLSESSKEYFAQAR